MKYIKLFEAFQSTILSKTLGYLDKWSKPVFLEHVKKVCKEVDFPISELNDDYFQYLPFKKALSVNSPGCAIRQPFLSNNCIICC